MHDPKVSPEITEFSTKYETSLIETYIEAFSGEPWNDVWEYDWVLKRLHWLEAVPNFIGLIAVHEDQVVGALLGYAKPFRATLDVEILELFVLPKYQGQGVGKRLVAELEQRLDSNEFGVVHLLTARDTDSEAFYKNLGYERNEKLSFMVNRRLKNKAERT
jgi:ribosomal protein S18 acetylase RimI-like enzyme